MTRMFLKGPAIVLGVTLALSAGVAAASPVESQGPRLKAMWAEAKTGSAEYSMKAAMETVLPTTAKETAKAAPAAPARAPATAPRQ